MQQRVWLRILSQADSVASKLFDASHKISSDRWRCVERNDFCVSLRCRNGGVFIGSIKRFGGRRGWRKGMKNERLTVRDDSLLEQGLPHADGHLSRGDGSRIQGHEPIYQVAPRCTPPGDHCGTNARKLTSDPPTDIPLTNDTATSRMPQIRFLQTFLSAVFIVAL